MASFAGANSGGGQSKARSRQIRPVIVSTDPHTRELPVFVGRHRELAKLHHALQRTRTGQGSVVILVGEAGIGKTLTSEVFAREAGRKGVHVLRARCYESEEIPPYEPVRAAIRAHIAMSGEDALRAQLGHAAADVAQIVPELADKLCDLEPSPDLPPGEARFRLFESLALFFRRVAETTPLVLIMDNLDWADTGTLQFLEHMSPELGDSRILVVGTHRPLKPHDRLSETMGELVKQNFFLRIAMTGFTSSEIAEYLGLTLGRAHSPSTVQSVYRRTEGNPLFLVELVREMNSGELDLASTKVPQGVSHAIDRRIRKLPSQCREILTAAAVVGRVFDLRVLATTTRVSQDHVIALLELAMHEGLIAESEEVVGRFFFTHALIRQAILSWLSVARRSGLHGCIARALEDLYGSVAGPNVGELVRHLYEAGEDTVKLARYAIEAAESFLKDHAPEEALAVLDKALKAREADPADRNRDCDVAALCHCKGKALGSATVREEAIGSLTRAFEIYRELGELAKAVDVAITPVSTPTRFGWSSLWTHTNRGAENLRQPAMALVTEGSVQHGWLLSHQGGVRNLESALAIAIRAGDAFLQMWSLAGLARDHAFSGQFDQCQEEQARALALAEAQRNYVGIECCHFWSHYVCKILGDHDGALRHLGSLVDNARLARSRLMLFKAHRVSANFHLITGDWESCRASVAENLSMPLADRRVYDSQISLLDLALIELYTRGLDAAQEYLHRLCDAFPDPGLPPSVALVAPKIARMTGVSLMIDSTIPVLQHSPGETRMSASPYGWSALARASAMATVAVLQEDFDQVRFYLEHFSGLRGTLAPPNPIGQPTDGILGMLCLTLGRVDEAVGHYDDAAAFCRGAGYQPELAWALYNGARALLQRGETGDAERASQIFEQSRDLALRLDMRPLVGLIEALQQPAGRNSISGLTERQVEVLCLVARGLTNHEIGEALFISEGTVARHMHNILDRTGTANRAEVTAFAMRHGLVD